MIRLQCEQMEKAKCLSTKERNIIRRPLNITSTRPAITRRRPDITKKDRMKRAAIMPISHMATICMLPTMLRKPRRRTPTSTEKRTSEDDGRGNCGDSLGLDELVDRLNSQKKGIQKITKEHGRRLHTTPSLRAY